jgi:hypothetical protein
MSDQAYQFGFRLRHERYERIQPDLFDQIDCLRNVVKCDVPECSSINSTDASLATRSIQTRTGSPTEHNAGGNHGDSRLSRRATVMRWAINGSQARGGLFIPKLHRQRLQNYATRRWLSRRRLDSKAAGNNPISHSKASTSARVAPRLRHSVMTSSMKSRPTGKYIGPMTTRRPFRAPWKKPSCASAPQYHRSPWPCRRGESVHGIRLLSEPELAPSARPSHDRQRSSMPGVHTGQGSEPQTRGHPARQLSSQVCTPIRRLRVVWMANLPRSVAIHLRPSLLATAAVVPDPTKKSATRSPSFVESSRIRESNASALDN